MTAIAAITKEKRCPICQRQFVRGRRSNRFRQSGRPNEEHIYCSSGCRQKAYRRRVRADRAVTQDRVVEPIEPQMRVRSGVTHPKMHTENIGEFRPKTRGGSTAISYSRWRSGRRCQMARHVSHQVARWSRVGHGELHPRGGRIAQGVAMSVAERKAKIEARRHRAAANWADINRRIRQIDAAVVETI